MIIAVTFFFSSQLPRGTVDVFNGWSLIRSFGSTSTIEIFKFWFQDNCFDRTFCFGRRYKIHFGVLAFIKELEIPNVKDLIELDFKSSKNLKKVKIHANFSPKKPLPSWIKVTQISFDPSKTQDWINLEYTSKSAVILDSEEFPDYQEPFDLSNIAEMKNLESLHFICWLKHTRDLEFFMPPKLKTLQSNCPKINSLKLGIHWYCKCDWSPSGTFTTNFNGRYLRTVTVLRYLPKYSHEVVNLMKTWTSSWKWMVNIGTNSIIFNKKNVSAWKPNNR